MKQQSLCTNNCLENVVKAYSNMVYRLVFSQTRNKSDAYVDGMLHIQTSVANNFTKDNHGYFFLVDKNGNKIQCDYNVGFVENSVSDNRIDYNEFVFNIPQSEIAQYSLYGTFVTSGLFTQGNWQVTFPLQTIKN